MKFEGQHDHITIITIDTIIITHNNVFPIFDEYFDLVTAIIKWKLAFFILTFMSEMNDYTEVEFKRSILRGTRKCNV